MYNIPYDYRPSRIWYKIKCFFWHRYTTTKPRFLGHTWCDKVDLLPHTMFEMLCQFVEKEADQIDWDWSEDNRLARAEMQDLYDWWISQYYDDVENCLYKELEKLDVTWNVGHFEPKFKNSLDKAIWYRLMQAINNVERMGTNEININMHRLIEIREYLWA